MRLSLPIAKLEALNLIVTDGSPDEIRLQLSFSDDEDDSITLVFDTDGGVEFLEEVAEGLDLSIEY